MKIGYFHTTMDILIIPHQLSNLSKKQNFMTFAGPATAIIHPLSHGKMQYPFRGSISKISDKIEQIVINN